MMELLTHSTEFQLNDTFILFVDDITIIPDNSKGGNNKAQSILIAQSAIASVGIMANLTVIVVFLNHKKLRRKIPNIFIINQVGKLLTMVKQLILFSGVQNKGTISLVMTVER